MLERDRLELQKISKTGAVTSMLPYALDPNDVHVGPSDYVPWLTDRKFCYIRMEGTTFGNVPLNLEAKLEVWDFPQFRRCHHRCRSMCQTRPGSWAFRSALCPGLLFYEDSSPPIQR